MLQDSTGISANMVSAKKYRMVLYCHTNITVSSMSCQVYLFVCLLIYNFKLVLLDSMATVANLHVTAMARPSVMPGQVGVSVLQVIKGITVRKVRDSFFRLKL